MSDDMLTQEQIEQSEAEEHAAFIAAVNGESPEPAEEQIPEEPEEKEEEAPEPQTNGLSDEVIAKLVDQVAGKVEGTIGTRLRNVEGSIGGMKQKLDTFSAAAKTAETKGAEAPNAQQLQDAAKSSEKLKALKAEFPEWGEALEETRDQVLSQIPKFNEVEYKQRISNLEKQAKNAEQRAVNAEQQAVRNAFLARQMSRLDATYPEWETTIRSDEYKGWLSKQPQEIQVLTQSENATDALRVLDAYVAHSGSTDLTAQKGRQSNTKRLETAVTPTHGRTQTRSQPKTEHELFLEAFNSR